LRRVVTTRPGQAIQVLRRSAGAKAILVRRWANIVVPAGIEKVACVLEGKSPNEFNLSANPYAPTPSLPISLACHLIPGRALERYRLVPRSWYLVRHHGSHDCASVFPSGFGWSIDVPISIKSARSMYPSQPDRGSARSGYQNNGTPFRLGSLVWHTPSGMSRLMWCTPDVVHTNWGVALFSILLRQPPFQILRHSSSCARPLHPDW